MSDKLSIDLDHRVSMVCSIFSYKKVERKLLDFCERSGIGNANVIKKWNWKKPLSYNVSIDLVLERHITRDELDTMRNKPE